MNEKDMMHGIDWQGQNLAGWMISEKMDGCRAYWDGQTLWSRGGIAARIPDDWKKQLPTEALDCELYDGIGGVYRCGAALKYGKFFSSMRLIVFDAPDASVLWADRMEHAKALTCRSGVATCAEYRICESSGDALRELERVKSRGGEGLMLRAPSLTYTHGRNSGLLKVKRDERF